MRKNKLKVFNDITIYSRIKGLYTLSSPADSLVPICVDMPLDKALEYLKEHIEERENE